VIVERVRHLLATRGGGEGSAAARERGGAADGRATGCVDAGGSQPVQTDDPLLPEHLLVLTYNVKAAAELRDRIEQTVGVATAARITVSATPSTTTTPA
jgi:ATP-dependent exoDNAse (exonuclease V) beta subunit